MKKYQIKEIIVDEKKKYGIVDYRSVEVISPDYDEIIEKDQAFVLRRKGYPDEIFYHGNKIIQESDSLEGIQILEVGEQDVRFQTGNGDSFQYQTIELSEKPVIPRPKWPQLTVTCQFSLEKFSRKVELLWCHKVVDGQTKTQLRVRQRNPLQEREEFDTYQPVSDYFDELTLNQERQFLIGTYREKGKTFFQLIPYTYYWDIYKDGKWDSRDTTACIYGQPILETPFLIYEKIEDFELIPDTPFIKIKVNGKWGVIEVQFLKQHSPFDLNYSVGSYSESISYKYNQPESIEFGKGFDFLPNGDYHNYEFILEENGVKKLLILYKSELYFPTHGISVLSPNSYSNIEKLGSGYQLTLSNGKVIYGNSTYQPERYGFFFQTTDQEYEELKEVEGVIQGFYHNEEGNLVFDLISEDNAQPILESIIDYQKKETIRECISSNGKTTLFNHRWKLRLKNVFDVNSYTIHELLGVIDVEHKDGTHTIFQDDLSISYMKEKKMPLYGDCTLFYQTPSNGEKRLLVKVGGKDSQRDHEQYFELYLIEHSGVQLRNITNLFQGYIKNFLLLPEIGRVILTTFSEEKKKLQAGVLDTNTGEICLPFEFGEIGYQEGQFIGKNGEEVNCFDSNGTWLKTIEEEKKEINPQKRIGK